MIFIARKGSSRVTYKAHNSQTGLSPVLTMVEHDGTVLDRLYLQHDGEGLYSAELTVPDRDTYIALLVDSIGHGTVIVGTPKVTKVFYYTENSGPIPFTIRDITTHRVLQQGTMESVGHNLHVLTTTLDGAVHLVISTCDAAALMLPFRPDNLPLSPIRIRAEYNAGAATNCTFSK